VDRNNEADALLPLWLAIFNVIWGRAGGGCLVIAQSSHLTWGRAISEWRSEGNIGDNCKGKRGSGVKANNPQ
jgi:hypothetical protein